MANDESSLNGQDVLDRIEADLDMENLARAEQIRIAAEAFERVGDKAGLERAQGEWLGFRFTGGGQDKRGKGQWFGPVAVLENDAGNKIEVPSKDQITPAILAYWRSRALTSINPHVQARMSDLLWEFEDRADAAIAERAIRSYLDIVARHLQRLDDSKTPYVTRHLERALILAEQIRNDALRAEVLKRHGEAFDIIIAKKRMPITPCCDLLTSILNVAKRVDLNEIETRLDALDTWMDENAKDVDALFREDVSNLRINVAKLQNDQSAVNALRLQQARNIEAEGDAMVKMGAAAMIIQSRFQRALERFSALGATEDTARLKGKLVEVNRRTVGELRRISSEVKVPTEHLDELVNFLRQFRPRQAVEAIALSGWWIPSVPQARTTVAELKRVAPLQYLVPKVLLDQDGNYRNISAGPERDRHDLFECIYRSIFMDAHIVMRVAFDTLREMSVSVDDFLAVLGRAPWLDPGRLELLREAFDAYFRGRYVSAMHILIPQLEGAVRDLSRALGEAAVAARSGRMRPQTLDIMLSYPRTQQTLGEDFVTTMQALLTDDVGLMIRHRVMHGNYSNAGQFSRERAEVLIYLLLHLSNYGYGPQRGSHDTGPEAPADLAGPSEAAEPRPARATRGTGRMAPD